MINKTNICNNKKTYVSLLLEGDLMLWDTNESRIFAICQNKFKLQYKKSKIIDYISSLEAVNCRGWVRK